MNGRVLVTGAGGFVGSAVVRELVQARAADVVAVVRPGGSTERLEELGGGDGWRVEQADLTDRAQMVELMRRVAPRAVVHVAVDQRIHDELSDDDARRINLDPIETLFEGLAGAGRTRLVHTSSSWVLPPGEALAEDAPVDPRSRYGARKAEAEELVARLGARTGVEWITLRVFNMFGRYEPRTRLLPYLVSRLARGEDALVSSGEQVRDFTDVDDVARAYRAALDAPPEATRAVYHVGSGTGTTVRRFALAAAEATGNPDRIRFGAIAAHDAALPVQVADASRARTALGWESHGNVEGRITAVARWWLERLDKGTPVGIREGGTAR